jgi:hypothetical protein
VSSALAVAGVTAVLRDLLESWLDVHDANAALNGASASVTAVAPDTVELTGANAGPQLNLFLYQVSHNQGWRNVDLPSRDARGRQVSDPPLALDLHYLLTAYGPDELQSEVLLGYGVQLLHEMPVLDRQEIDDRLPVALQASHLGQQVELIKVTPERLSPEELSRLWGAFQAKYRPTATYQASVVLIESNGAGRTPLPVLTRGPVDPATETEQGILATPGLEPALPGITAVRPPGGQPGATLGETVEVDGHNLGGANRAVRLENRILEIDREVGALAGSESGLVRFTVPNLPAALAIGTYALSVLVQRPGETDRRETNRLPFTIVPRISTALPLNVATDAQGTAVVELTVRPQVRPHQRATLLIGGLEVVADDHPSATSDLTFTVEDAPVGEHLLRVRVDGIETPIADRSVSPPAFLDRRLVIT